MIQQYSPSMPTQKLLHTYFKLLYQTNKNGSKNVVVIRRLGSALGFQLFARYFVRVERKAG
jgi:hypothetical protein